MKKLIAAMTVILVLLFSTVFSSAAEDPSVVLVNPVSNSTIYSSNLLISVKLTQPKTIKVSVFVAKQIVNGTTSAVSVSSISVTQAALNSANYTDTPVMEPVQFVSTNNLSFYTKQVNDLKPGLYKVQVDTLDGAGKAVYTSSSYVAIKEKVETAEAKIIDTPQTGTMQFLQNLLQTIFGD